MTANDKEKTISSSQLPPDVKSNAIGIVETVAEETKPEMMDLPLREAREIFEKQYLSAQLMRFDHNITKMAMAIGMERSALHRKLKSLNITSDE